MTSNDLKRICEFIRYFKGYVIDPVKERDSSTVNDVKLPEICKFGAIATNISYVRYCQGCFSYFPCYQGQILLSDEFSGCAMIQYSIENQNYIGHIAMDSIYSFRDNLEKWDIFKKSTKMEIQNRFFPYLNRSKIEDFIIRYCMKYEKNDRDLNVLGVIIDNICYSCVMDMTNYEIVYIVKWRNTEHGDLDKSKQLICEIIDPRKLQSTTNCVIF